MAEGKVTPGSRCINLGGQSHPIIVSMHLMGLKMFVSNQWILFIGDSFNFKICIFNELSGILIFFYT